MRLKHVLSATLLLLSVTGLHAQPNATTDSDRDGLSDSLEDALLKRFAPEFMISRQDCSVRPAAFRADAIDPTVVDDDGTIYGQAFPLRGHPGQVELHYYHLWRRDCGEMGHRLDAEHVSVLVNTGPKAEDARAVYWYAAAHEDTICDASHLARAAALHAEDHGATVWISAGKHASFLSETLCAHGCGGDRCENMEPLSIRQIVNLGEADAPMNAIAWLRSPGWPLRDKLTRSDFPGARVARVEKLHDTEIAWANPAKRPAQAAILGANTGVGGAATGARATDAALDLANTRTSTALGVVADRTGGALKSSSRHTWDALKKSARKTKGVFQPKPE